MGCLPRVARSRPTVSAALTLHSNMLSRTRTALSIETRLQLELSTEHHNLLEWISIARNPQIRTVLDLILEGAP